MPMYDLIEYSNNYFTKSGSLQWYFRDRPNATIRDSGWFKFKARIIGRTHCAGYTKNVVIAVLLKYFSNIWRTPEILLINCKINFTLTWSANFVITYSTGAGTFTIAYTKL